MRGKILVVANDLAVRNLTERFLTKLNYQVDTAADIETARAIFQILRPDLVILDMTLPDNNIHEFRQEIQIIGEAFVLMLTNYLDSGIEVGEYLRKPFALGELEVKVSKILSGGNDDGWGYYNSDRIF
ncbi:two component transcriptional regulator [Calothrix brevissima NIES-22]|nr:two component transcriptional regulator [Calothrix brevissima NIES-22]